MRNRKKEQGIYPGLVNPARYCRMKRGEEGKALNHLREKSAGQKDEGISRGFDGGSGYQRKSDTPNLLEIGEGGEGTDRLHTELVGERSFLQAKFLDEGGGRKVNRGQDPRVASLRGEKREVD